MKAKLIVRWEDGSEHEFTEGVYLGPLNEYRLHEPEDGSLEGWELWITPEAITSAVIKGLNQSIQ